MKHWLRILCALSLAALLVACSSATPSDESDSSSSEESSTVSSAQDDSSASTTEESAASSESASSAASSSGNAALPQLALTTKTDTVTLAVGEEVSVSFENPQDAALSVASLSSNPAVSASVSGNTVTIKGVKSGSESVTVLGVKDGYQSASVTIRVTVALPENSLSASPSKLSLAVGQSASVTVTAQASGTFVWEADSSALSISANGAAATVTAQKTGSYTIKVTCKADGRQQATVSIPVTVSAKALTLTYPNSASVAAGKDTVLTFSSTVDVTLTASCKGNIEAEVDGMDVIVTGVETGSATLTVTASATGYEPVTVKIPVEVTKSVPAIPKMSSTYKDVAKKIFELTNEEREAAGLSALKLDSDLSALAEIRSEEASELWSHTRPDGRSSETVLSDYGISYYSTGENLFSANLLDASAAVDGWMNSTTHRANILRAEFTKIGIAVVYGDDGYYYYTQIFLKE